MKIHGLNNRDYSLDHTKYPIKNKSRSIPQQKIRCSLQRLFPTDFICEELPCLGAGKIKLDFYIHRPHIAFEVDGEQHDEFNEFFHGSRARFAESQRRDHQKDEWCILNNVRLFRISTKQIKNMSDKEIDILIAGVINEQN